MMTPLLLPANGVTALVAHIRTHGRQGVETGAVLLTAPGDATVATVALPGTLGVIRAPDRFILTMPVIDALFTYAEQHALQARVHVHSHGGAAFLSRTDRAGCLRMPGFVAAVVPTFRTPPLDPALWGWWSFADGDWHEHPAGTVYPSCPATVVTFDAEGVR